MTTSVTISNPHNFVRLTFSDGETRTLSPGTGLTAYLHAVDRKVVTIEELTSQPEPDRLVTLDEAAHGHE